MTFALAPCSCSCKPLLTPSSLSTCLNAAIPSPLLSEPGLKMSNNNDASSSEGGTGTGGGTRPPALGKTGTARPLLDNLVSLPPKDAVKGNRIKPGSFSLGSPLKPSTRASAAFAQLLQSLASQAAVDEGGDEQGADLNEVFPAIVKVFTTHTFPNYSLPWQMKRSMWDD